MLFRHDQAVFALLMVGVTAGSGLMGVARGTLTARRRFGSVAAMLVAENAVRLLAALALVVADVKEPVAFGLCLVAGHLVAFCWPSSLRLARGTPLAPLAPRSASLAEPRPGSCSAR
ncbi:MAG: hypothetical protein WKF76_05755 [Nocardioidaceae bacterium]